MGRTKPAHDETASAQVYHSVVTETQYTAQKMDLRSVISKSLGQHDEPSPRLYTARKKRNENGHRDSFLTLGYVIKCA